MPDRPDFAELCRLEPRLAELDARARATRDDRTSSFYCSNFVWLPIYTSLRSLLGAYRLRAPRDEANGALFDSRCFEDVFLRLSRLLPPCRDCGCRRFEPVRESQLGAGDWSEGEKAEGP